jgi:exonuclease III
MVSITIYLTIITLNINGLNSPIKRHRLAGWIEKEDPTISCLQETHLIDKVKKWLKVKGWKKLSQVNGAQKQAQVSILTADKADFKPRIREIRKVTSY